ncbi:adenylate kinase 9 isoform X1 [Cydia pomonella]|uniref:adenylate kinase 9 isoform X1 n=1 Tax=Cydia pomonella TaxID=82600 RepID=UPI002ADE7CA2|nr:adenylate kinase 9 isoform X1 [Cydia pomonella]
MIRFETFKNNLDVDDKSGVKDVNIDKSVNFRGCIDLVNKNSSSYSHGTKIPPLGAAIVGLNNTDAPLPEKTKCNNAWTDIDAQELFLSSKPTCYLILGKPGVGAYTLGESISKKLNCIHLCPRNVIVDETEQKTSTGKCMDFNMRHNKKKKRQKKDDETGTSLGSQAEAEQDTREEEAEEEQEPEDENVEEEEEPPVELPKFLLEPCSGMISCKKPYMTSKKVALLEQFKQIMKLPVKPDVVIYITSSDADAISKKQNTYLNYGNACTVYKSISSRIEADLRWPIKCYINEDHSNQQENHIVNSKYYCRQPMNFKENSVEQMCNFRKHLLTFMECQLKQFEPATIIKLDGCIQVYQMMQQISERLLFLYIKPVCVPEPMYLEDPSDDLEEFWQTVEELAVMRSNNISFNRYASLWYNRCPVELKKRISKRGHPKFAVTFLKHVYLMSTLPSMIQFCRNPRPFLKLAYLEPTCRAIVVGTKSAGKTMICKCLEWLFDAQYINFNKFYEEEKIKKEISTKRNIFSEIIATIEDARFALWQTTEFERVKDLNAWYDSTMKNLKKYLPLLVKYLAHAKCSCAQESVEEEENSPLDLVFLSTFQKYRNELLTLPFVNDVDDIKRAIADKDTLMRNGPDHLITPTEKPLLPVMGDADVTEAISAYIVANELQKDLEPTPEELVTELCKILDNIDKEVAERTCNEKQYGKWVIDDFPSDPEYWGFLIDSGFMPDYTIALIENREIEADLMKEYKIIENSVKHYQERFILADDPLINTKLKEKHLPSPHSVVKFIVHDHQAQVLDDIFNDRPENAIEVSDSTAEITAFTEAIEKFRENWTEIQSKIEESNKCHVVVELENKTDVSITEEVLLKLRQCYYLPCIPGEPEEIENLDEDDDQPKDTSTFNLPYFLCETNVYCPIAYYDHGVLWEGKPEYSIKYNNKLHLFSNENCLNEIFSKDVTKYQSYSKPFKLIPCLRICVMGRIGSGKTTIAKYIAKELGLIHVDFVELVNDYLIPRHFKKIGRKYENSFTDTSTEEENAVEIQMGEENLENLEADLMANESELRRMLNNYFEQGTPLLSILLQKLLKRIWFQKPFCSTGIVLDGFPRMASDVEDMVACYCIPDLIIDVSTSSDDVQARTAPNMYKTWKAQMTEAKHLAKMKFDKEKSEWLSFVTQKVVCKLILDDILNAAVVEDEPVKPPSTESNKIEVDTQESDLMKYYNEIVEEFPEPVDISTWENASDARDRIEARIDSIYEIDDGNIESLRDPAEEQKIKIVSIDNTKSLNKTLRKVSAQLKTIRNRSESFLEQTFILDPDVAESLLLEGFYFISRFNRMCPVHIFENPYTIINPYKVMKTKGSAYTVAHRSYIYFISGKTNLKKFRLNPLKYIVNNNITNFIQYPLRYSIIGPPKCGKSELAMKLAKKYGLICISKGKAIRHVLDNMHWTELAEQMLMQLREGKCIETGLIIKAVQIVATDHRTVTNGCVFDGFPDSVAEAMGLLSIGLYPLIIFDLSSDKMTILDNSHNEIYLDIIKYKPPYSRSFIENRFISWAKNCLSLRDFVKEDIQNIYLLNGNESRWQCLKDAILRIQSTALEICHYLHKVHSDVVPAGVMCVSNEAFKQKMSCFKNLCPVCLSNNTLKHNEFPVDKKGVLQYKYIYYWVCEEHLRLVLNNPDHYLAHRMIEIPEIPAVVKRINPSLVYENGICIVSYAENLPAQKIQRGSSKFAANYHGHTYLFCSAHCLKIFLAKPQLYYNVVVFKDAKMFPKLSLKNLPHIGYLEQTVGDMITEACCSVNVLRPKYPGLDIKLSGLLYIALYLKTHNIYTDKSFLPKYLRALEVFEARCKLMINVGLRLRAMDNPFSKYPICHHPSKRKVSKSELRSLASGDSLGDAFQSLIAYDSS